MPHIWMQSRRAGRPRWSATSTSAPTRAVTSVDARTLDDEVAVLLDRAAEEHGGELANTPMLRGYVQGREPVLREAYDQAGWRPDPALLPDAHRARRRAGRAGVARRACARATRDPARRSASTRRTWTPSPTTGTSAASRSRVARLLDRDAPVRPVALVAGRGRGRAGGGLAERVALLRRPAVRLDPCARRTAVAGASAGSRPRCCGTRSATSAQRGATKVGLGVDGENTTGAVRLYETVGMRQVRRNDTYEKSL